LLCEVLQIDRFMVRFFTVARMMPSNGRISPFPEPQTAALAALLADLLARHAIAPERVVGQPGAPIWENKRPNSFVSVLS